MANYGYDRAGTAAVFMFCEPARARALVQRIEFCYTPKHGSWLNTAECELSAITR